MTTGNKILWKRGEIAPNEQFLLFSTLFYIYIFLTSGFKLHIQLLNVVVQFIVFLTLSTLICGITDISKCFSESLGIRDNGSRLYMENNFFFSNTYRYNKIFGYLNYSRLSLPRNPREYFEISVPRHVRFAELRKKMNRNTFHK